MGNSLQGSLGVPDMAIRKDQGLLTINFGRYEQTEWIAKVSAWGCVFCGGRARYSKKARRFSIARIEGKLRDGQCGV